MAIDFHSSIKTLNLKVTPKRLAILDILASEMAYVSPEEVWRKMKERFGKIGLPTVYRNLEDLAQGDLIIKIIHPDRKLYYYFCHNSENGHHHHFICLTCRKVEDLDFCGLEEIKKEVEGHLKGSIVSHLIQVYGLCRGCKQ
ncbi:MAG: transcriptional repressor [Syntrophus sp. (in: bacteria)]|nr:transcriptional repressor [Syntrophus sp. (in: bacteria)]